MVHGTHSLFLIENGGELPALYSLSRHKAPGAGCRIGEVAPSVLKNAIDWASRPYGESAWDGKPVGIMGASVGMFGTGRAQYHLRQMFVFLNMFPLNQPEVMIANADEKFDGDGNLKDEKTAEKIRELLQALADWTRRLKKAKV